MDGLEQVRRRAEAHQVARPRVVGQERDRDIEGGVALLGCLVAGQPAEADAVERQARDVAVPLLADDPRPRYLMGLGSPADLLEAAYRGVDLFDSVLPARVARNGQVWVPGGRLNLRNQRFLDDPAPIQDDCPCLACRAVLAGLSRPSVPGKGAARVPSRDLSQPDLHPRLHDQDPSRDQGRNVPRLDVRASSSRGPDKWR